MGRLLNNTEIKEFKDILASYSPNNKALDSFKDSDFVVIAGPAGAGKDTLRNALVSKYPDSYMSTVCDVTRPAREGEVDGKTYYFKEVEEVRRGLEKREYFQAALIHDQQICCLHVNEMLRLDPKQHALSILVPTTEAELRELKKDIKSIFLIPPNGNTLIDRINEGRELSEEEIQRRLNAAVKEIEFVLKVGNYFCIITDTKESVVKKAHNFIQNNKYDQAESEKAHNVMKEILQYLRQKT